MRLSPTKIELILMEKVDHLACVTCGKKYNINEVLYVCPECGLDNGTLDVIYDYEKIRSRFKKEDLRSSKVDSLCRYLEILPVSQTEFFPPLRIGWTPLYRADRLEKEIGLKNLWIKDDTCNPSASLKDRASVMAAVRAKELGRNVVAGASTGNAATSMSCVSAYMGLKPYIFVPERAPKAKVAQLLIYGAKVIMVQGTYDQCFSLCWEASEQNGWYSRNTAINPFLSEGKKTASLEICEQLEWVVPDKVFCSVGDGCIFGGLHKGFRDFYELGFIDKIPEMIGVQAEGSAVLYEAFKNGSDKIQPLEADTIADSICVGHPRDWVKALRAVRETGGSYIAVSDDEILEAQSRIARATGIFGEPAGVTAMAGVIKMREAGDLDPNERIVALVTGHGLKDIESAMEGVDSSPILVKPNIEDIVMKVEV